MKRITDITRGYATAGNRNRAVKALFRRGYNHFVFYRDTQAEFALLYAKSALLPAGYCSVQR